MFKYIVTGQNLKTDEADWTICNWDRAVYNAKKWAAEGMVVSIHRLGDQVATLGSPRHNHLPIPVKEPA